MLECRACVSRCIRAIAGDEIVIQNLRRPLLLTPNLANRPPRRRATTAAAVRKDAPQDALSSLENSSSCRSKTAVISRGNDEKALKKELDWLKDPVKFADHVHYTLRSQNVEKAINLCRLASKSMSCIVAWNHLIDWHIKNQKVNAAIDIYNEMKKRGQFPDSHTYMILFRAVPLQKSHDLKVSGYHGLMANKAVAIYNSMSSPTSRVKPSIMHTNAVLRLCSLARNLDLLWSVASQIPESGPGSADHITYSILLSAIRFGAMGSGTGEMVYLEQIAENRSQAVSEGRRIWQEIIPRWRAGEVTIDAALVRSMAKLLTLSKRMEDWDDVLNLVQQTTNISRLIPPLGSPERNTGHVPQVSDSECKDDVETQTSTTEDSEGWVPTPASNAFKPVSAPTNDEGRPRKRTSLAYVQPENGILNVLLEACTNMRIPKTAYAYWDLFVKEYNVVPDLDNYEVMLRLLRINRSSRRVVELMKEMQQEGVRPSPRTYRIAMGACARDKNNTHVVENMTAIIDEMISTMPFPDIATLDEYIDIAVMTEDRAAISAALEKIHEIVDKLDKDLHSGNERVAQEYKERIVRFYGHVSGVVNTFSMDEFMEEGEREKWQGRRREYDGLITAWVKRQRGAKRVGGGEEKKDVGVRRDPGKRTPGAFQRNRERVGGMKKPGQRKEVAEKETRKEQRMRQTRMRRE